MINLSSLSESEILGLTIIGEARGESIAGQVAVGNVIKNRVKLHRTTFMIECLKPKQFSCWNEDDPNYPIITELAKQLIGGQYIQDIYLQQCMYVAEGIVENELLDNTNGAINYLTNDLLFSENRPHWAVNAKNLRTIGNQTFFNV